MLRPWLASPRHQETLGHPRNRAGVKTWLAKHVALQRLVLRGVLLYIPLRIILSFLGFAARAGGMISPDHPLGILVMTAVLGGIDLRRRGEAALWSNLGYGVLTTRGVFAAVALAGELLIAAIAR